MWEHLYKIESGRDVGTLYYFRNLFGRNNVKQKVKDEFAPAEDLFLQVFNAYLVVAFMDWTGMMEIQSPPTKVSTPPDAARNQKEKTRYLNNVKRPLKSRESSSNKPVSRTITEFLHNLTPLHQVRFIYCNSSPLLSNLLLKCS